MRRIKPGLRVPERRIGQSQPLFHMGLRHTEFSLRECDGPTGMVGLQQKGGVVLLAGKAQKLLFPFVGRLQLALYQSESIEAHKGRKMLRRRSGLLTELMCADVRPFYFRSGPALGDHQQRAESGLQRQLLLGTFRSVWQGLKQIEGSEQVIERFRVGRPLYRLLPGKLEVVYSLLGVAATTIVIR